MYSILVKQVMRIKNLELRTKRDTDRQKDRQTECVYENENTPCHVDAI